MTNGQQTPLDPVQLCQRNARRLGIHDVVVAGDPGCGAALVSNIVYELGFGYLDPYTEVLNEDGTVRGTLDMLSGYRQRLSATAGQAGEQPKPAGQLGTRFPRRFVKTHLYPEHYAGVPLGGTVLLVRDPRDSIYSSYKWFCGFSGSFWPGAKGTDGQATFAEFLDRRRSGDGETPVTGWARFNECWLDAASSFGRFAVVRYEELKSNPVGAITGLLTTLGVDAPLDVVTRAAERSSFDAMRTREEEAAKAEGESKSSSARIMRRGKVGEWREWYGSDGLAERFADPVLVQAAARFGYTLE